MSKKLNALAKYLDVKKSELEVSRHDDDIFEYGREEYRVLTDDEADEAAKEYILETVWAFNPSFLAAHLKPGIDQEVVELIQSNDRAESNNEAILSLIDDVDHFVDDAIRSDGRGHFLSSYDGDEIELSGNLYAYRVN